VIPFYLNNTINLRHFYSTRCIVLYPQNGDPDVTIDSVTLLHRMYSSEKHEIYGVCLCKQRVVAAIRATRPTVVETAVFSSIRTACATRAAKATSCWVDRTVSVKLTASGPAHFLSAGVSIATSFVHTVDGVAQW